MSIGLLAEGHPALGVVFAFAYPDDEGDLFAWAEGCGALRRNGRALSARLPEALGAGDVVLLSSTADRDPATDARPPTNSWASPASTHNVVTRTAKGPVRLETLNETV